MKLTGYPSQNADPSCGDNAYAGACRQYSSTDVMQVGSSGMYSSSNLDLCRGHSGGGVMTADANRYLVGIVTGEESQKGSGKCDGGPASVWGHCGK